MFDESKAAPKSSIKLDLLPIYRDMAARHRRLAQAACDSELRLYYVRRMAYWERRIESLIYRRSHPERNAA